jgi:predicted DNA-binding transcriptional regulator YafY
MYFPTTRVLTVLELLQSHPSMSGTALAARLEVNRRTLRRYITMLQDLGIPMKPNGASLVAIACGRDGACPL